MNKSKLVSNLVEKNHFLSKSDVEDSICLILESLSETLAKGGRVELRGFGTFWLKDRNARKSRNPRTGEVVFVESKTVPYFRMGKELKDRINKQK